MKLLPNIFSNSSFLIISASVLFAKISLLFPILFLFLRCLKIAMNGVMPAPPAMNVPSPLYSIAPHGSLITS